MKAGRNDACPCGSGKKYKKCCLAKDQEQSRKGLLLAAHSTAPSLPPAVREDPDEFRARPMAPSSKRATREPRKPVDPEIAREEARWDEFKAQDDEGRIALYFKTLDEFELKSDELAFAMLECMHDDAVKSDNRARFADCVAALRERQPKAFAEGSAFFLSWCLLDALAEDRRAAIPLLARQLAGCVDRDIDLVDRGLVALAYHGQLPTLVEARRIAWPLVKASKNVVPWGVSSFADESVTQEIFDYLEQTSSPDATDPHLLDRLRLYDDDLDRDRLRELIEDLTGTSGRTWQTNDFALRPTKKRNRDDWDEDDDDREVADPAARNLQRLLAEFTGYLRRSESVPFPRGDLVRRELYQYFLRRHEGNLDPRPSMIERALRPNHKLPKPPSPVHPLCPERVTLDTHLGVLLGMFNCQYHRAAATFLAIPAWLRFLESRQLIDADTRRKVANELLPLHATLMKLWMTYSDDPSLEREALDWPENALGVGMDTVCGKE